MKKSDEPIPVDYNDLIEHAEVANQMKPNVPVTSRITHTLHGILLFLFISILSAPVTARASEPVSSGYIVKISDEAVLSTGASDTGASGGVIDSSHSISLVSDTDNLYRADTLSDITNTFSKDEIEYVEPDYYAYLYDTQTVPATVNDTYYSLQEWYTTDIGLDTLWEMGIEGQDSDSTIDMNSDGDFLNDPIVVAVVDSGMTADIPDIDYSRILTGWNVLTESEDVTDDVYHGTFITSMLIAEKNNENGIAGLLQNITVLPVKAFTASKTSYTSIIKGINYATNQKMIYDETDGADGANVCVINLSLGGKYTSKALKEACDTAMEMGILVVCAAGNNGNTTESYPAQYTMGIGSVGKENTASDFTQIMEDNGTDNYRNKVWVCAPGESIYAYGMKLSATTNTYTMGASGTSFSCPIVASLGAILKAADNDLTQTAFMDILAKTAVPIDSGAGMIENQDFKCGYGLVDFKAAYQMLTGTVCDNENENTDGGGDEDNTDDGNTDGNTNPCETDGHLYVTIENGIVAPTCTENGYTLKQCSRCLDIIKTDYVDMAEHAYETVRTEPTCTHSGHEEQICEVCGATANYTELPATAHTYETIRIEPTCTHSGYEEQICEVCGDTNYTEFPATGHHYETIRIESTCTSQGVKYLYCTVCKDAQDYQLSPTIKHHYHETIVDPTYTAKGYSIFTCDICGGEYISNYTDKYSLESPYLTSVQNIKSGIKLTWKKTTGAAGYSIYRKTGSEWEFVKQTSGLQWTDTSTKNGVKYTYRIRAYVTDTVSKYSTSKSYVRLSGVTIKSLKNDKKSTATLKYSRNTKATGYIVKYSTKSSMKSAKTIVISSNKTTAKQLKKLTKGKTYYIQIRSYKKTSTGTYYSAWVTKTVKSKY